MAAILRRNEFYLLAIFVFLSLLIGYINPGFWSPVNIFTLLKNSVVIGVFSLGVMVVIVSGGIDISFPAFSVFSFYITTKYLVSINYQGTILLPFAMALLIGMALGFLNAFLISTFRLAPLIVTLGTGSAATGFLSAFVGTGIIPNLPTSMVEFSRFNLTEKNMPDGSMIGLSGSLLIYAGLALLLWLALNYTTVGRGIYCLGGDPVASLRVGFNNRRLQYYVYGLAGALAGVAGIIHSSLIRQANPRDLEGFEMEVIAAVVLGGASLTGGRGTVLGTILGVLILVLIKSSLILVGIPSDWQKVAVGLVLIIATIITAVRSRRD